MKKRKKGVNLRLVIGILVGVVALAFLTGGILLLIDSLSEPDGEIQVFTEPPYYALTQGTTKAETTTAATKNTDAVSATSEKQNTESASENKPEAELPEELSSLLTTAGYSEESLDSRGIHQLITVESSGSSAQISFFELGDGGWTKDEALTCSGFVGSMGTLPEISEQTSATPQGLIPIGSAFYQYSAPTTGLDAFEITNDTYWVDDPDSKYYNQRVEGTSDKDWDSAEHLMSISLYKYGFVINHNTPAEYNKGSAIFFHIGSSPTEGCVATSESNVLAYLEKLNASENPYILII